MKKLDGALIGKLLIIRWRDPTSTDDWFKEQTHANRTPIECVSVGWLIGVDDSTNSIVLASTYDVPDGNWHRRAMQSVSLPRGCVESFEVLRGKQMP